MNTKEKLTNEIEKAHESFLSEVKKLKMDAKQYETMRPWCAVIGKIGYFRADLNAVTH